MNNPLPKYAGWSDPQRVETLGRDMAARLRDARPDRILIGDDAEDVQLAHVVARELGSQIVRVFVVDGIFAVEGDLSAGHRVVLLSDAVRKTEPVTAIELVVQGAGAELVAVAALVETPELAAVSAQATALMVVALMSSEEWRSV